MTQQDYLNAALNLVSNNWQAASVYGGVALLIAIVLQYLKRHYKLDQVDAFKLLGLIRLDGPRIVMLLYTLFTGVASVYMWLLDPANAGTLPAQFAVLFTVGAYVHRFLVSPGGVRLQKAMQPYLMALEQVKNAQLAAQASAPTQQLQPELNPIDPNQPQK